jgi:hypothetical protein
MAERKEALERWGEHIATLRAVSASPVSDRNQRKAQPVVLTGKRADAGASGLTPEVA